MHHSSDHGERKGIRTVFDAPGLYRLDAINTEEAGVCSINGFAIRQVRFSQAVSQQGSCQSLYSHLK
jgi:hypothetical protein